MSFPHATYQPLRCPGCGLLVGLRNVGGPFFLPSRSTPHAPRLTPHAPRSLGSAVDAARQARYSTPHPEGSTCYDMLRFPLPAEVWRARFSAQVNIRS